MRLLIITSLFLFISASFAAVIDLSEYERADETKDYIIRLVNGDIVTGKILEVMEEDDGSLSIRFATALGKATIFDYQIAEINPKEEHYRHYHRVFLLPTADPIGNDHFIGDFELLFLYGGFGVGDILSVNVGRTLVPTLPSEQQGTTLGLKATVYNKPYDDNSGRSSVAIGGNFAWVGHNNNFIHMYGVASFKGDRSVLTTGVFFKLGRDDFYQIRIKDQIYNLNYFNGSLGLGIGLDTKFTDRNDLHFIGELWNSDITKPTNTGILLGFRLANTRFSADFGLALFTQPLIAPFFSFCWTPF